MPVPSSSSSVVSVSVSTAGDFQQNDMQQQPSSDVTHSQISYQHTIDDTKVTTPCESSQQNSYEKQPSVSEYIHTESRKQPIEATDSHGAATSDNDDLNMSQMGNYGNQGVSSGQMPESYEAAHSTQSGDMVVEEVIIDGVTDIDPQPDSYTVVIDSANEGFYTKKATEQKLHSEHTASSIDTSNLSSGVCSQAQSVAPVSTKSLSDNSATPRAQTISGDSALEAAISVIFDDSLVVYEEEVAAISAPSATSSGNTQSRAHSLSAASVSVSCPAVGSATTRSGATERSCLSSMPTLDAILQNDGLLSHQTETSTPLTSDSSYSHSFASGEVLGSILKSRPSHDMREQLNDSSAGDRGTVGAAGVMDAEERAVIVTAINDERQQRVSASYNQCNSATPDVFIQNVEGVGGVIVDRRGAGDSRVVFEDIFGTEHDSSGAQSKTLVDPLINVNLLTRLPNTRGLSTRGRGMSQSPSLSRISHLQSEGGMASGRKVPSSFARARAMTSAHRFASGINYHNHQGALLHQHLQQQKHQTNVHMLSTANSQATSVRGQPPVKRRRGRPPLRPRLTAPTDSIPVSQPAVTQYTTSSNQYAGVPAATLMSAPPVLAETLQHAVSKPVVDQEMVEEEVRRRVHLFVPPIQRVSQLEALLTLTSGCPGLDWRQHSSNRDLAVSDTMSSSGDIQIFINEFGLLEVGSKKNIDSLSNLFFKENPSNKSKLLSNEKIPEFSWSRYISLISVSEPHAELWSGHRGPSATTGRRDFGYYGYEDDADMDCVLTGYSSMDDSRYVVKSRRLRKRRRKHRENPADMGGEPISGTVGNESDSEGSSTDASGDGMEGDYFQEDEEVSLDVLAGGYETRVSRRLIASLHGSDEVFKVGHKLEAVDPRYPQNICEAMVIDLLDDLIRVRLQDLEHGSHTYWISADSDLILPIGYTQKYWSSSGIGVRPFTANSARDVPMDTEQGTTSELTVDKSRDSISTQSAILDTADDDDWEDIVDLGAAPDECFKGVKFPPPTSTKLGLDLRVGHRLEFSHCDYASKYQMLAASILSIRANYVLVQPEGMSSSEARWLNINSYRLKPIGWACDNAMQVVCADAEDGEIFNWQQHLIRTRSIPAPPRIFSNFPTLEQIQSETNLKPSIRLELLDENCPRKVYVYHVVKVTCTGLVCLRPDAGQLTDVGVSIESRNHVTNVQSDVVITGDHVIHTDSHQRSLSADSEDVLWLPCDSWRLRAPGWAEGHSLHVQTPEAYLRAIISVYESSSNVDEDSNKPNQTTDRSALSQTISNDVHKQVDSGDIMHNQSAKSTETPRERVIYGNLERYLRDNVVDCYSEMDDISWLRMLRLDAVASYILSHTRPHTWSPSEVKAFVCQFAPSSQHLEIKSCKFSAQAIDGEAFLLLSREDLSNYLHIPLGLVTKIYACIKRFRARYCYVLR